MVDEILKYSAHALIQEFKAQRCSPIGALQACLRQIERYNPRYNALCFQEDETRLFAQAEASLQRWQAGQPLGRFDGVPITIKDGINVAGWPTRDGSRLTSDAPAERDELCVARLRSEGAIFLGKTTMPEFGLKGVTDSPLFGITRNPWDESKTAGGSSGGAAVAAAFNMGYVHLGSDGGGSLRIPASFCGVVGFKPTQGQIINNMVTPFSPLASNGPMARYADDVQLMYDVMLDQPSAKGDDKFSNGDLRVLYVPSINDVLIDPQIEAAVQNVSAVLGEIVEVKTKRLKLPDMVDAFNTHWMAITAWIYQLFGKIDTQDWDPYVLEWAQKGRALSLDEYMNAQIVFTKIQRQISQIFADYDFILMPTMALPAFAAGQNFPLDGNGKAWEDWSPLTFLANIASLPAISLPCGLMSEGLPIGVQLMANKGQDQRLLNMAAKLEQQIKFSDWLETNG